MEFFCASEKSINRSAEVNILHPAMALLLIFFLAQSKEPRRISWRSRIMLVTVLRLSAEI